MPSSTPVKSANQLVPYAANNAPAGTPQRATFDLRGVIGGGILTGAINNMAVLTAQCVATIYTAHTSGATPGATDAAWKPVQQLATAGLANGARATFAWVVPAGMQHGMIEFAGNTGGACSVESALSTLDSITTA